MLFDRTLYNKYVVQVRQFLTYGLFNTTASNTDNVASDSKIMRKNDLEKESEGSDRYLIWGTMLEVYC